MSRRPLNLPDPKVEADFALTRMAPGGLRWSESPLPRVAARRVRWSKSDLTLSEVMALSVYPGQLDWGTAGGAAAEAGDVAIQAYEWLWNSTAGPNVSTPTGWTSLGTWQFDQIAAPNGYKICLAVIYKQLTAGVAAGTSQWLEADCWPYLLSGSTYIGRGTGMVLRGTATTPSVTGSDVLLNTGRTSMLPAPGAFGQQVIMGQSAVTLGTGARLVTNPNSSAYLRGFSAGQTIRGAMTKILEGASTGPLPGTTEVYGETLTGGTYVEHNYNYVRLALGWS